MIIARHDVITNVLMRFCKEQGVVARTEVMVVEGTSKRMDLVVYLPNKTVWFDVSVVNETADSYVGKDALGHRAETKRGRWKRHADARGIEFIPLIFSAHGAMDKQVHAFIAFLTGRALVFCPYAPGNARQAWKAERKRQLRYRIAVALAHATHMLVEEACVRSMGGNSLPNIGRVLSRYGSGRAVYN